MSPERTVAAIPAYRWGIRADGPAGQKKGVDMTVTRTPARGRTITGVAGAAAAFVAAAVLTAGGPAGEVAAVSAEAHLAGESTTAVDDPAQAAKRRITKSNTSDYLTVVLKEAG
jgi:hypothetical protein